MANPTHKDIYFQLMRETSDIVYPVIEESIGPLGEIDKQLQQLVRFVVDKRDPHLMLRPFLIRLAYEACGGTRWQDTINVGAAYELINISSYQANSAFDGKYGITSTEDRNSQFIASMITRELAFELLTDGKSSIPKSILSEINIDLSLCNKYIYFAQHFDMNLLTISNRDKYTDEDVYLKSYIQRCHMGCGIFTGLCAKAGGLLAGATSEQINALVRYGNALGTALQIVNDLADFVPPTSAYKDCRHTTDWLCDLNNGRLTAGVYWSYKDRLKSTGSLSSSQINYNTKLDNLDLARFLKSDAFAKIKQISINYGQLATSALSEDSFTPAVSFLIELANITKSNKYLQFFDSINRGD